MAVIRFVVGRRQAPVWVQAIMVWMMLFALGIVLPRLLDHIILTLLE